MAGEPTMSFAKLLLELEVRSCSVAARGVRARDE
jgi:hypothetical protein